MALVVLLVALAAPPTAADQTDSRLDALFARLVATDDAVEGELVTRLIWHLWLEVEDSAAARDLTQGVVAMQSGEFEEALGAFDRVVDAAPNFAEGWNKRATLYYLMEDYRRSMLDIERTLSLEPRHFGALSGIGLIYMAIEDDEKALAAFEKALEVNPHMPGVRQNIETVRERLAGKRI